MKCRFRMPAMWLSLAVMATLLGPLATPTDAQRRGAARPQVERPEGEVWEVIRYNCISCHGIDDYGFFALDRAGWESLIDSKHEGLEVGLSAENRTLLLDWLVENFGADSTPFPREYVPPEITTFFTDPEAYRLFDRACTTCHSMDRINAARNSMDGWRVILVEMRELGAEITDLELERLVEWLSRVKGINPNQ